MVPAASEAIEREPAPLTLPALDPESRAALAILARLEAACVKATSELRGVEAVGDLGDVRRCLSDLERETVIAQAHIMQRHMNGVLSVLRSAGLRAPPPSTP